MINAAPNAGRKDWISFAALVLLPFAACNWAWLAADQTPPFTDAGWAHLPRAVNLFFGLSERPAEWADYVLRGRLDYGLPTVPLNPPLNYLVTCLFFAIGGPSVAAARAELLGCTSVLLAAVFAMGFRVGGRSVGLIAAALATMSPILRAFSGQYFNDVPLAAMTALAGYAAMSSEGLTRLRGSLAFGICCGLGLMIKLAFPIFGAPMVVVLVGQAIAQSRRGQPWRRTALNAILGAGAAILIAFPWWYANKGGASGVGAQLQDMGPGADFPEQLDPIERVLGALAFHSFPPYFFAIVVLGAVASVLGSAVRASAAPITAFLAMGVVSLAQFGLDTRYALPLVPAACVVAACGVGGRFAATVAAVSVTAGIIYQLTALFPVLGAWEFRRETVVGALANGEPNPFTLANGAQLGNYRWLPPLPDTRTTDYAAAAADLARLSPGPAVILGNPLLDLNDPANVGDIIFTLNFYVAANKKRLELVTGDRWEGRAGEPGIVFVPEGQFPALSGWLSEHSMERVAAYHLVQGEPRATFFYARSTPVIAPTIAPAIVPTIVPTPTLDQHKSSFK